VEGLRTGAADLDHDGKIALDELYEYVYERVLTSGYAKQTPHKWAQKVQGQIVVAHASSPDGTLPTISVPPVTEKRESSPDVLTIHSPIHLELVRVPAGKFLMGSTVKDNLAEETEIPQHIVDLPEFYIGKYPVTNIQYAAFVEATEHKAPEYWEDNKIPSGKEEYPVVQIDWCSAIAFCKWVSQKTGKDFTLPSEAEWEKAARGTDGRIYPWGNESPLVGRCNFKNFVGGTTLVGKYSPQSDSPYGCADMAGNVWEWTRSCLLKSDGLLLLLFESKRLSAYFVYPYDAKDGRENLRIDFCYRAARGGAFNSAHAHVRATYRHIGRILEAFALDNTVGFRVVCGFPQDTDDT
jgi:formylglycine-generating enzyme required for sulfatase activity